jgi:arsenate reductase
MAEAFLRKYAGDRAQVFSAGTDPKGLHPLTIESMEAIGIDMSGHRSDSIEKYRDQPMDYVITVCDHARENCPWFPAGSKQFHHSFPDPAHAQGSHAEQRAAFDQVRELISTYCRQWVDENLSS